MCKTILSVQWDTLSKADKVMIFLNPFIGSKVSHSVRSNEKYIQPEKNICLKKHKKVYELI